MTLANGKLSGYTKADIWTVGVDAERQLHLSSTADGKRLSMDEKYSSTPWIRPTPAGASFPPPRKIASISRTWAAAAIWSGMPKKNNWSAFGTIGSNEALFAQQLYLVGDEMDQPAGSLPQEGARGGAVQPECQGVLAQQNDNTDSPAINSVSAQITDGKAIPRKRRRGVHRGAQRRVLPLPQRKTYGYLCSNGTGNNAFYSQTASEDADWTVEPCSGGVGGYQLESRTAKFNGRYSQYLEYYSDSYKTYSMYNVTDYTIYSFFFYGVADSVKLDGGVVNDPAVVFTSADTVKAGRDYTLTFTVNDVGTFSSWKSSGTARPPVSSPTTPPTAKNYTANVSAAMLAGADKVTPHRPRHQHLRRVPIPAAWCSPWWTTLHRGAVTPPEGGSQTGSDKRPVISRRDHQRR